MSHLRLALLGCLILAGAAPASHAADTDTAGDGDAHPPVAAAPVATAPQADAVPPAAPVEAPAQADAVPPKAAGTDPNAAEVRHLEHIPIDVRFDAARRTLTLKSIEQNVVTVVTRCVVTEAQALDAATLVIRTATGQKLQFAFSPEEIPGGLAPLVAAIQAAPPLATRPGISADTAKEIASLRQERIDLLELKKRQLGTPMEKDTAQHLADLEQRLADLENCGSRPMVKPFTFETLRFAERSKQVATMTPPAAAPTAAGPTAATPNGTRNVAADAAAGPTGPVTTTGPGPGTASAAITAAPGTTPAAATGPKITTNDIDRNFAKLRGKAFDVAAQQRLVNASRERPSNGLHRYERDQEQQAVLTHRFDSFATAVTAYNTLVKNYNRQVGQDIYQTVFTTEPENLSTMKAPPKN